MKNKILIAGGIVGIVALAYYFIKKSTERGYIKDSLTNLEYGRIVEGDLTISNSDQQTCPKGFVSYGDGSTCVKGKYKCSLWGNPTLGSCYCPFGMAEIGDGSACSDIEDSTINCAKYGNSNLSRCSSSSFIDFDGDSENENGLDINLD
jgi:hypothetical protein